MRASDLRVRGGEGAGRGEAEAGAEAVRGAFASRAAAVDGAVDAMDGAVVLGVDGSNGRAAASGVLAVIGLGLHAPEQILWPRQFLIQQRCLHSR